MRLRLTSPAGGIAAQSPVPGGFEAFIDPWPPANEGYGAEGVVYDDLTIPANPGTSPSVSAGFGTSPAISFTGSAYQIAFHGANGHLWLYNATAGGTDARVALATGTSPAIG